MAAGKNLHDLGFAWREGEAFGEQCYAGLNGDRACGAVGRAVRMGRIRRVALSHSRRSLIAREAEQVLIGHVGGAAALRMEAGVGNGKHAVNRRECHDDARVVDRGVVELASEGKA